MSIGTPNACSSNYPNVNLSKPKFFISPSLQNRKLEEFYAQVGKKKIPKQENIFLKSPVTVLQPASIRKCPITRFGEEYKPSSLIGKVPGLKVPGLFIKIQNSSSERDLHETYKAYHLSFTTYNWVNFIFRVFEILNSFNMDTLGDSPTSYRGIRSNEEIQEAAARNFIYLEKVSVCNIKFKANTVSNIFSIFNHALTHNRNLKPSKNLTDFLMSRLNDNVDYFDSNQLFHVVQGIKKLPRTSELNAIINKIYLKVLNSNTFKEDTIVEVISTFNTLGSNCGLKLWGKLNIDNLPKTSALKLLNGLQFILPHEQEYYPNFDFSRLLNRVKNLNLTHSEFIKAYVASSACEYSDFDWNLKAAQMLSNGEVNRADKLKLKRALYHQAKIQFRYNIVNYLAISAIFLLPRDKLPLTKLPYLRLPYFSSSEFPYIY